MLIPLWGEQGGIRTHDPGVLAT